jgi:hypothetical protein
MTNLSDTKRIVSGQNSILGLFKARQIQQTELSKGLCACGYRFVTSDPVENYQVSGQQLQDRSTGGANLYIDFLFANDNKIVALFKSIAMARELKGRGQYYHRFVITDTLPVVSPVFGGTTISVLLATQDLLDL